MHRLGEELSDGEEGAELGGGRPAVRVGADLVGGVRQIARAWISRFGGEFYGLKSLPACD